MKTKKGPEKLKRFKRANLSGRLLEDLSTSPHPPGNAQLKSKRERCLEAYDVIAHNQTQETG